MEKTTIHITGMHCRSCEILIEDELSKIPGVKKCVVSHTKGTAEIYHNNGLDEEKITQAVGTVGYKIGKEEKPILSKNPQDYYDLLGIATALFLIYILADNLGLFKLLNVTSNNFSSLPVVLMIGLTAGFSTCMALVGGLILGASARFAEKHPSATTIQKFKPHIFFNLGRIASYFFFGGVVGFAGSFFQLSPIVLGILTIFVGGVMFLLGAQLIDISPRLNKVNITLPKFISRALGIKEHHEKEYSHKNAMIGGAMTFFLPCGFTQAMQLYAISTGNPVQGAITMGAFAIGTAPGLLGIGGLTSAIKGVFAKTFFKFAGLVVIVLAIFNISNGYNLTGIAFASPFNSTATSAAKSSDPNVVLENGVQIVRMTQNASGYTPNTFTVKKDVPVKWIITSEDVNTCASSIVLSALNIRTSLNLGENILEFTPKEVGVLKFSCSMGMYRGAFNVVESNGEGSTVTQQELQKQVAAPTGGGSCGDRGGCGCGAGTAAAQKKLEASASTPPAPTAQQGEVQVIKTAYTQDNDIQPNRFSVKKDQPVRMEIDVKDDGYGCMGSIMVPGLTQRVEILRKGTPIVFNFTPTKIGDYQITCAMGIPRGVIRVN
ncbi:sulfite exporter TauE/SafE family protein [Candidatus Daviesbacteria bacterium]|nr:sulfite exporter TauE/SafE family protein [Candidatus Daviesbacteria bacterium]